MRQLGPAELTRANVLLGYLDLPSGDLGDIEFERYVKTMALFADKLIIPDGWLVCDGPVYRYLRRRYGPSGHSGDRSEARLRSSFFHELLGAEVIVPGLRGERPRRSGAQPRGYDFLGTWMGTARKESGGDFGNVGSDERRMMILERTFENEAILRSIHDAIKAYVPWEQSHLPVTAVDPSPEAAVREWDDSFRERTRQILLNGELSMLAMAESLLEDHAVAARTEKSIRHNTSDWLRDLDAELRARCNDPKNIVRRGTIEDVIGTLLCGRPLRDFSELQGMLPPKVAGQEMTQANETQVRAAVASTFLSRISTAQELMFANRFRCTASFHAEHSDCVLAASQVRLQDRFANRELPSGWAARGGERVAAEWVPVEALTVGEILSLRQFALEEGEFLHSFREGAPIEILKDSLPRYLKEIAEMPSLKSEAARAYQGALARPVLQTIVSDAANAGFALILNQQMPEAPEYVIAKGLVAVGASVSIDLTVGAWMERVSGSRAQKVAPRAVLDTLSSAFGLRSACLAVNERA